MKKYETIIFDLDGTLLDTLEDLKDSVNYALGEAGLPERSLDEIRRSVGNGAKRLMELVIPGGEESPVFDKVSSDYKEHYALRRTAVLPCAGTAGRT